ncbi:DNA-binding SARP family transcriptional activator [Kutzneria viridogrisea]|uniref:DNA-binding SARP family transcriptional activator n=1 Tax=Kutzneria viridogrisea TaxID=47990 RepID=A0ABR6BJI6_9PSEU|nr:DNA-binding SARP family transcriptional activator [Kutzneria viridogrisea]
MAGAVGLVGRLLRGLIAAVVLAALVVGLPWVLVHYVGWPLPHHVPTWPELQVFLLAPMSVTFLLDFLACACWIVWFAFTLDVLRCTIDIARSARWPDLSGAGPMHTLAGVLVGAVLLSVLGNRPAPAPSGPLSGALGTGSPVVATAPARQNPATPSTVTLRQAVLTTPAADSTITEASTPAVEHPVSVIVRAPENGVHDSLWRIAQRTLGDGDRWPEIWHLNEGKPQPGGRTFTQPSLIYPGQELDLPANAAPPPVAPPVTTPPPTAPTTTSPPATTASPTTTPPPASSPPATPAPTAHHAPATGTGSRPSTREPGFRWEPDLFVGLGLAAAISAALLIARRRYRARYQPGSGDRDDFPVTPVVYQLRLAHLRAEQDDEFDLDDDLDGVPSPRGVVPLARVIGATETDSDHDPALTPRLGVRDGREIALNLAVAHGLGLVGAGAPAAARALLVTALSTTNGHRAASAGAGVVVPTEDLVPLLGRGATRTRLPAALLVADSLDGALDALEAEILVRAGARTGTTPEDEPRSWPTLVLAATVPEYQRARLQAVLDNGAPFGITGLLLGQWQPGVSAYIRTDGTVSAVSPGLGETLRGAHVFHLGDDHTAELLTLLAQAEPAPPPRNAHGDDGTPPTVLPRIVRARPDDNPAPGEAARRGRDRADRGPAEPVSDTELEITAAAQPLVTADGELEILAASRPTAPGVRLRPPASARPRPATGGEAQLGEVKDTPAPPREHGTTAATPMPVTGVAQDDADTARALITISVLGALRVLWHPEAGQEREITDALQPRAQELLVLLALHPGGTTRDTLVSALWGEDPPTRPTNALHTALSRLRHDLIEATGGAVTDIASADNGHYRLDPATVDVDYWRFERAVAARRAATTDAERIAAYREVVNSFGGPLAEGLSKIEWLEPAREAIRRDAIDAVSGLARALVEHDPQQTLDLLEVARAFDPHNELLYRDIMRLQERLGQLDAIPRTLTLLTTRLAEVNEQPTPQARGLAARLGGRRDHDPADHPAGQVRPAAGGERGRSAAS